MIINKLIAAFSLCDRAAITFYLNFFVLNIAGYKKGYTFAPLKRKSTTKMVSLAQLVRASDCGSEGRGFDPHTSPSKKSLEH